MKKLLFVVVALGLPTAFAKTDKSSERKPNQVVEKDMIAFDTAEDIKIHDKIWQAMENANLKSKCHPKPCDEDSGQLIEGKASCYRGKQGYWCSFRK